ncbi:MULTISPECIES: ParB N-terminal domain-containing protein [Aneurinibacillus]|uniref:ParB N-terminal domain-containing protein n=1 Tax=Aneurinibacillus thermoaerophilus TaxID=143495 RepID=A0A1G8EYC1_ANETH|nr:MULTISPECIES: ParB N-terminal domain-containing protein [Aneurinibacillus]AMA71824.1 hypothetical protein ACH33_02530 [Aneurinibacillus sp. XH2]MED0677251.1 ParB N-terminal domain-containing protein [Aneurinibacillus thermoaerophilus]MED0738120.1 ParB N-terminal domain-containing protein [Aneurinibacillus thermoaerophilus]QYY42412.1 ParB N-terminal domain-containing protein [Aneurinibacillus thermoaerophilus]SDH74854.1 ParB-like nuclease domain-containing protein [Aneurinibacillus thermoaer
MDDILSSLRLIDIKKICLHEEHEHTRLAQTCAAISTDGVLRHPPLAMQMSDGRYLILDGAHRTNALQNLGCKRIAVQIIEREEIQIGSWDHVIPMGEWLEQLKNHPSIRWQTERVKSAPIVQVVTDTNKYYVYEGAAESSPLTRLAIWHLIVNAYRKDYSIKRIISGHEYHVEKGMVRLCYPAYTLQEIESIVLSGAVMPAGVTRVVVNGRLLNLNIPLSYLMAGSLNQAEWEQKKEQWARALRLYAEAVYLCEV